MTEGEDVLELAGLTLRGVTRGGIQTCVMVPELDVMIDVGGTARGQLRYGTILVTHGHQDHLGGLLGARAGHATEHVGLFFGDVASAAGNVGLNAARMHTGDVNARAAELLGERLGQAEHGIFSRVVGAIFGEGHHGVDARNVHDVSGTGCDHMR